MDLEGSLAIPTSPLLLGLDSSTTACKAIAFDLAGRAVSAGRAPHALETPRPAWHEQDARGWWQAAVEAIRQALEPIDPRRLAGLSISIQRETFVLVDAAGEPVYPALVWLDERARSLLDELDRRCGKERVLHETGKPLSANLTLSKLLWISQHEPDVARRTRGVWDVHAYLTSHLLGRAVTSWGCADPGGCFDMPHQEWHADLIRAVGFNPSLFPPAVQPGARVGQVGAEAERQTGLPQGLPVFAGLGDGQAAGLGVNAAQPGDVFLNLGTAVVSGTLASRFVTDLAFRTHTSGLPGQYDLETVLLGGTYTIDWFIERFMPLNAGQPSRVEAWDAAAASLPPGAQGLLLVPYWNSAMNPYWDASASGLVMGWRGTHTPAHLYRAILEGIAYELRVQSEGVQAALREDAGAARRWIAVGGGAKSRLWRQIIADVTGVPVVHSAQSEASSLGAAMLAGWGAGLFESAQSAAGAMARLEDEREIPDAARRPFYERVYSEVYRPLFPAVRGLMDRLAEIGESFRP